MSLATTRARLLASTIITGISLAGFTAAHAAEATATAAAATSVQELVVTGSRIPQPNLTSVSPITSVGNVELKLSGTTRVEDLLNQLPQVIADQGGNLSNGATGTATISLRNLGPNRTLVLIDGRRIGAGDPGYPYADLNFVPAGLIDRVEVLTGGASSTYGSDAVAGVVNLIMKKNFEGLELQVNGGGYNHDNNNTSQQAVNTAKGYTAPNGTVFDGKTVDVTATFGLNDRDGKGNIEGYVSYRHVDAVTQGARDYSNCTESLNKAKTGFVCGGSATAANASILVYDANFNSIGAYHIDGTAPGNISPGTALYNYAPLNYYQRPDERYTAGFYAHYDVRPNITAYADFMFMDDHSRAQIAGSGDFGTTAAIPCNDPLLSAQQLQAICVSPGYSTAANPTVGTATNVLILRRNVEGGGRVDDLRHTDYRTSIGLKGDLGDGWHFDVSGQYWAGILQSTQQNYFANSKIANALDVIPGPGGTAVCASGPPCVPYNIWTPGGVTQGALNYLQVPGILTGQTTEQVVSVALTGDLGKYGVKSPFAKDGIGVAFGAEYRRDTLFTTPDAELQAGDLAGSGGVTSPRSGATNVKELFAEARVPLAEDMPLMQKVNLELGYRFSHYSPGGDTSAYKIGVDWSVNDDLLIRGGYNRAVRAPNINELYAAQTVQLDGSSDPCAGPVGSNGLVASGYTVAQCQRTGLTAAQYGNIGANPANQYNGLTGGNTNLKPEKADTYTAGFVVTPRMVPGLNFSADYFLIHISNVIQSYGFQSIISECATTGDSTCGLIHRSASGSLWLQPTGFIVDTLQNLGYLETSGVDFAINYKRRLSDLNLPDWGSVGLSFVGTWTQTYKVQRAATTALLNCVGVFGTTCQGSATPQTGPTPEFKSKTRLTWGTPVKGLDVSLDWRYLGPASVDTGATGTADSHINAYNYFDLAASWRVKDRYTFRVGANNLFDRDPPIIGGKELPGTVGSGNTFAQVYEVLGRYIFMGVTADF